LAQDGSWNDAGGDAWPGGRLVRQPAAPRGIMAGGKTRSATSRALPSVSSVYPLRRTASLTSADRDSADRCWQDTLRERLGTPGKPPGAELLPSLYDPKRERRPASGLSRSAPPSTVGPSASIVAWFAQFQCEHCGRIPMALDARFCFSCGQALPLPVPPASSLQAAGGGGGASQGARNAAGAEAAAAARAAAVPRSRSSVGLRGPDNAAAGGDRAEAMPKVPASRPPRPKPPAGPPASGKPPIPWAARENQVAVWLGNIRPRLPDARSNEDAKRK